MANEGSLYPNGKKVKTNITAMWTILNCITDSKRSKEEKEGEKKEGNLRDFLPQHNTHPPRAIIVPAILRFYEVASHTGTHLHDTASPCKSKITFPVIAVVRGC